MPSIQLRKIFIDSIYGDSSNLESLARLADIYFTNIKKIKKKIFIAML
jgi:hypothetical protein